MGTIEMCKRYRRADTYTVPELIENVKEMKAARQAMADRLAELLPIETEIQMLRERLEHFHEGTSGLGSMTNMLGIALVKAATGETWEPTPWKTEG